MFDFAPVGLSPLYCDIYEIVLNMLNIRALEESTLLVLVRQNKSSPNFEK